MKLQIEHLAPYLPYGLEIRYKANNWIITGLRAYAIIELTRFLRVENDVRVWGSNSTKFGENFKPLLHPMSRLTEPILPDTRKFIPLDDQEKKRIPLVELAKTFSNPEFVWKVNTQDYSIECDTLGVWFGSTGKITIQHKCSGDTTTPSNQLEIYMKLFEWHFDVFGLIEQGLAIKKPLK